MPRSSSSTTPPEAAAPTAPVVTAIREVARGRIAVELDGAPWRVLSDEAVLAAGLLVGVRLDRERARRVRVELRRVEARAAALAILNRTDQTAAALRTRLAQRGVAPVDREAVVDTLERAGLVDDVRLARGRAVLLASRGGGDQMIRDDLYRRGVSAELVEEAIAELEPEQVRASRIVARLGSSPRTLRRLLARGFAAEIVEELIADSGEAELG